jgi:hypothetical protein
MSGSDTRIGERIGHFRLTGRLGAGGMGVVYRAFDESLRREVAIKVLAEHAVGDPERRARFLREARAAAAVTHPCIAAIHAIEEGADGAVHLVMELVEGVSLRQQLEHGALAEAEAVRIAREVSRGLARAHSVGIVHRDLKPENVMLGPDGEVKILDFGLAKLLAAELDTVEIAAPPGPGASVLTQEGRLLGTPQYMAPEQARGAAVDARADVHAVGVLLFEMIAGRRPYEGATVLAVLAAVLTERAPRLENVEPWLAELVTRCLQKDPAERPVNGRALLELLRAGASEVPAPRTSTPADSPPRVTTPEALAPTLVAVSTPAPARPGRKHAPWVAAAGVVLVGALALAWGWRQRARHGEETRAPVSATRRPLDPTALLAATRLDIPEDRPLLSASISLDGTRAILILGEDVELRELAGVRRERLRLPPGFAPRIVQSIASSEDVIVSGVQGGTPTVLRAAARAEPVVLHSGLQNASLSPDGSQLAGFDARGLVAVRLTGGAARTLMAGVAVEGDDVPTWSPDGRGVLVRRTQPAEQLVYVTLEGATTPLLGMTSTGVGFRAAFVNARTILLPIMDPAILGVRLCRLSIDSPDSPRCFGSLPFTDATEVSVDASGRRALLLARSARTTVRVARVEGDRLAEERALDLGDGNLRTYGWIDERTLLVGANRAGHWEVLASALDGTTRTLASLPGVDLTRPALAPDADDLVAFRLAGEPDDLGLVAWSLVRIRRGAVVETLRDDGARTRRSFLARPPPAAATVGCAAGICVFATDSGEEVRYEDLATRRVLATVPTSPTLTVQSAALSPDGRWLVVASVGGVDKIDVATGTIARHFALPVDAGYLAIAADGAIYCTTSPPQGVEQELARIASDGRVTTLAHSPTVWSANVVVSPSGTQLAYVTRPVQSNTVSLVELPPE